jgi:protein-L-isoaspartate O-methyltransferase
VNRFHRCYCASRGWARLVQTTLVPAVLEGTELGRRVLEIGPGPGLTTEVLAGVAAELTAIEIDPTLAKATRRRVPAGSCRRTRRGCRSPTPPSAPWSA